jgi:hypothetical protein
MKIDVDLKERVKIVCLFFLQFYKVIMGTMLSLFVSQKCIDDSNITQICTLEDNIKTDDIYHRSVLIFNGFTLFLFLVIYYYELRRENWCVENFDIDHTIADNNLKNILDENPQLKNKMFLINKRYYFLVKIILFVYFINFILSGGIIFDKNRRNGSTTFTGFISFTLLVSTKLYDSFIVSRNGIKGERIQSSYLKEYSSFNILDTDYHIEMAQI